MADEHPHTEPVTGPGPTGQVVVSVDTGDSQTLTWNVGVGNTGSVLTFPADEETITALEGVGC